MAGRQIKKMTLTVKSVEPGEIRGQKIVHASSKKYNVKFDLIEGLFQVVEGEKIVLEILSEKPDDPSKYVFCGHGYLASKPGDPYTVFSVWGILFRFEPPVDLEPGRKYYVCISRR